MRLAAAGISAGAFVALQAAAPPAARADEPPPPVIVALDAPDADARAAAEAAFEAHAARDLLIGDWLRDAPRRAKLGAATLTVLCRAAGAHGVRAANPGLRAILRDADAAISLRRAAAGALEKTGGVADISALADAIPDVPLEASRALAAIGGQSALGALVRGGGETPPPEALAARAKLGDADALDALIAQLSAAQSGPPETGPRVAGMLAWATDRDLGSSPDAWRVHARRDRLARTLAQPDNDAAQNEAERLAGAAAKGDVGVLGDLGAIVADGKAAIYARAKAALAIGLSGSHAQNDVLLAATANETPGDVRRAAALALARVGDLSCAVPLANMLVHDEDRDRLLSKRVPRNEFVPVDPEFVRCLSRRGLAGGGWPLLDILEGEYRTGLQRDAMRAFEELSGGDTRGYEPDASAKERSAACYRLRMFWRERRDALSLDVPAGDPGWPAFRAGVDVLIETLKAQRFLIQSRAKKALVIVAEPASEQLIAALSNDVMHIRMGAAEVMAEAALSRFVEPLAKRLAAETNAVARTKILAALETCVRRGAAVGGAPLPLVRETVRGALGDRLIDVRIAAVRVLGVAGEPDDIALIAKARSDARNDDDTFRSASAMSLLRLGDRSALGDLVVELRSDDVARRTEAIRGMRIAGLDVPGYDPDAAPEAREAAVAGLGATVPPGGQR